MNFRRVNHVMLVPKWGTMVTTVVTSTGHLVWWRAY